MEPQLTYPQFNWNTWAAGRPAELSHLTTGLRITPILYSDRATDPTSLPPGDLLRLGCRGIRDGRIEFASIHEDTQLNWTYDRGAHDDLTLNWQCKSHGEWGLRYWVNLSLSGPEGTEFSYDEMTGVLTGQGRNWTMSLTCGQKPLLVTVHETPEALIEEFVSKGYFYLGSRGVSGQCIALRFNLDETPDLSAQLSMAPNVPHTPELVDNSPPVEPAQSALQAVHDVLSWNHVMDPVNNRPYTVLTRNWDQRKFGGFGVWMNDNLLHALMWVMFDPKKARENIEAVFAGQTEAGNFPCLVTGNDAWLDRSQPPIASYVVWSLFQVTADTAFLKWAYPRLLANYRWWWSHRVLPGLGLVGFGTSADVGSGLYKGTKLGARNESGMDNMAVHDEAEFDPETGLLLSADVGLNSILALDGEILGLMADHLGRRDETDELSAKTAAHKNDIQTHLWDPERGVFANRLTNGRFVRALAPTSFFPMSAGIATSDQATALVENYLTPEDKFGGAFTLPSASRDQPAFQDNVYWRGRVWGPLNYWVYQGLKRYDMNEKASDLAQKSMEMFAQNWTHRQCGENYCATTGAITDQPDADCFYTWGALLPVLAVQEVVSETAWNGLVIDPGRVERQFGPLKCSLGLVEISRSENSWTLYINGRPSLMGADTGILLDLRFSASGCAFQLDASDQAARVSFPGRTPSHATFANIEPNISKHTITIPPHAKPETLKVSFGLGGY
ncbi:MGH1-like glycoside hydrolase domain-containing protein [Ruegeria hyattellae]|uniref:MGH1-like glycoside hydrolase domain-containing protein n=1 Tax=Ruegeria hyattellae TaxID=3233337 RepID=UPI00355B1037